MAYAIQNSYLLRLAYQVRQSSLMPRDSVKIGSQASNATNAQTQSEDLIAAP